MQLTQLGKGYRARSKMTVPAPPLNWIFIVLIELPLGRSTLQWIWAYISLYRHTHIFVHSTHKYFLSAHCEPGTDLNNAHKAVNKTKETSFLLEFVLW